MNQTQHIVHGAPSAFVKSVNKLAAERDVSLSVTSITCTEGKLAAVIEEGSGAANSPGSLIELRTSTVKDGGKFIADLQEENSKWSVLAAFASAKGEDKTAGVLVVAALRQP